MAKSLLNQFAQVHSSRTYSDDLLLGYAEQAGRHYLATTISTISGSAIVTDTSANSFASWEKENFIVEGASAGLYQITTVSGLTATVTPTPTVTSSGVPATRQYYQNLEDDLNYIRTQLKEITGADDWKTAPEASLSEIDTISGSLQIQIDAKPNADHPHNLLHTHYDVDMAYVADSTWLYSGDTFTGVPSNLQVFLDGVKNRANDSDYYNATVSGTDLVVIFAYPTSSGNWANATYTK